MRIRKRKCILLLVVVSGCIFIGRTLILINQVDGSTSSGTDQNGHRLDIHRQPLEQDNIHSDNTVKEDVEEIYDNLPPPSILEGAVFRKSMGNYEPAPGPSTRSGPGEYGSPVGFHKNVQTEVEVSMKEYSFNQYISDTVSVDREINDLREPECKHWHYPIDLPKASVILVFHNEGWSTLLRTVHSIVNRTPAQLLQEVILVDDGSDKDHLKEKIKDYIQTPPLQGKVKLIRTDGRVGLISARVIGAKEASGRILVWLDAHCEVGYNWLPPLITPIAQNRTTVVCPIVDVIDNMDFRLYPQGDGKLARGAFDWEFNYKRIPITDEEISRRSRQTKPYRSPVMAGGLFAMEKDYFFEMGGYDPGLQMWGGENYEISFKIWMCGGQLLWVPCSRVGHIYRIYGRPPYTFPNGTLGMYKQRNYLRVANVWMDDYKENYYAKNPRMLSKIDYGDISAQLHFRKDNKCNSFQWFLENIAYDVIKWYPPPPVNQYWGEIRPFDSKSSCLDTLGSRGEGSNMGLADCHNYGGNQLFRLTSWHDLRVNDMCVSGKNAKPLLYKCNGKNKAKITKDWHFNEVTKQLFVVSTKQCLDYRGTTVVLTRCDSSKGTQQWDFVEI
ncbi:N-acetylgalactosaminyltransferase 7-like [Glandiceps talaboti]